MTDDVTQMLIALDVDGTVVKHDGTTISPRVHSAIRSARAAGHHVVLSTGRSPAATVPVAAALNFAGGLAVCSNGAVTLRFDAAGPSRFTVMAETSFDPLALLTALGQEGLGRAVAVEVSGAGGFRATEGFPGAELAGDVAEIRWEELGIYRARRLILHTEEVPEAVATMAAGMGFCCIAGTTGNNCAFEIGPLGVSKASALEALRIELGVAAADTVAIGDHVNDIEMLRWAARGIAMGDAPAIVKHIADEVTAGCDDDGVALILDSLSAPRPTAAR